MIHHRSRPMTRDAILDQLWPEAGPEHSITLLHTNLYQLRKALKAVLGEQSTIKHISGQYRLDPALLACDFVCFEELLQLIPGELREAEISRLEDAVALYRGEYMEGLDYPWVEADRERLNRLYQAALDRLAELYSKSGEYLRAASCLRTILRSNPLLEEIHSRLMTLYACMGDRMAVIQQYETLTQLLEDELGIDPSPATRELYYKLCSEEE
jgi:two-component SAPR family response regulator